MLELGKESKEIHKELGLKIEKLEFNVLYTVGKNMFEMSKVLKNIKYKYHEDNLDRVAENILKIIESGDAILLKGSNSINLKEIIKKIINDCEKL